MSENTQQKINLKELIRTEYQKCAIDPVYFMKRYCYIQSESSRTLFDLYPYQEEALDNFTKRKYNVVLKSRQIGLSTLVSCYALWLILFHKDQNIIVIANKKDVSKNIITKLRFAFENLPVWLQIPLTENNKLSLRFKNDSQIKALASDTTSGRSEAVSLLIIDEAAHIRNAKEIWTAAQATLSTGGKGIIISTPNGIGNFFHEVYIKAEEEKSKNQDDSFWPLKFDWRNHPNRNEEWRNAQDTEIGPQMARQEYDADFIGSGNTVVDGELIEFYRQTFVKEPALKGPPAGDVWIWEQPDYTKSYIVVADVARGENSEKGDYSAFHVLEIKSCTQVAEFKGRIGTSEYGHLLIEYATKYNDALLVVENSGIGWSTIQTILDRGYKNLFYMTDDLKYVDPNDYEAMHRSSLRGNKPLAGFTTSVRTRPLIISKLNQYMIEKAVIIRSSRTINELFTFVFENGKPQAISGFNDDLVLSLSIALWIRDTALELYQKNIQYNKLAMDNINKVSQYDPVYTPLPNQNDPYKIDIGNGRSEDLRWLL